MTDTLFEQLGGTYTQIGDYLLPDLSLPAETQTGNIGVWALRHKRYNSNQSVQRVTFA